MGKAKGSTAGLHGWILPAKYSGYRSPRPVALIAYHMEKTGGSALMKWLHKHVRPEQPRLTSLFDYAHTFCFFGLYPDIFPTWSKHWEERCAPGAPALVPWQTSAVAVEFRAVDSMNQSVRDALREAARCDMHLYIDALRRTRLLIQQFSRDHADRQVLDSCAETELRNALREHE